MGALLLTAGSTTMLGTAPAVGAPRAKASPSASPSPSVDRVASAQGAESGLAVPDKVLGCSAGPGDGTFLLTFDVPGDGGSTITGYAYSTDNGTTWKPLTGLTGTTTKQATITHESVGDGSVPLGYNIPYNIRVRAVNGVGDGTPSDTVSAVIAPRAPDAPGPVTAGVVDGAITLSFNAPRDYGSPVTGWEYSTNNGLAWKPLTVLGSSSMTATIANQSTGDGSTALQAGQQYQLRLRARSDAGQGQDTQTYNVGIPNPGAPAAPGSVSATPAGEDTIRVDFGVPSPGGSAIIKYQYSTDDGDSWRDTATTGDGPLHADLTVESNSGFPFARGRLYRVRIRAVNSQGAGPPSDAAEATVPATAPSAPFNLGVNPRVEGGFTLDFGRPSDNGSQITGWAYTTDNGAHWKPFTGVTGEWQLTAIVTNQSTGDGSTPLAAGVSYHVRIHAINELGTGQDSQTVTASLPNAGSPAAPGDVSGNPAGENDIGVDFTAPGPGSSAIIKYQYSTDDGSGWRDTTTTGDGPLHADLTVESNSGFPFGHGNAYRVRVRAVNTQGPGWPSAATEVILPPTVPGRPFNLSAVPRAEGGFTLNFGQPSDNGRPITGWEYTTDNGAQWKPVTGVTGDWQLTATITNQSTGEGSTPLAAGVSYQVRIHAINELGTGQDSDAVTATLPNAGSPAAPTVVDSGPAGDKISVTFNAPGPGASAIIKYQYSTDDGSTWRDTTTTGDGPLHVEFNIESGTDFRIYPGRPYRVRIRAVNTQGPGVPSAATEVRLPPSPPGKTYQLAVVPRAEGGFALSFDGAPDNGSPITGWEYTTDNGAHWKPLADVSGDMQPTATITDQSTGSGSTPLAAGGTYQIRIHAINELGTGEDSDTVTVSLPNAGSPAAPGPVTGGPSDDGIGVNFTAPGPGDTPIIKYQYSTDDGSTWLDTTTTGDGPLHANLTVESNNHFPLMHGRPYRIRIRAVNGEGPGMPSAAAEIGLPPSEPGEPFDLRAQPGAGSMTLDFNAPPNNGSEITAWEYTTDNGAHWKPLTGVTGDWQLTATITTQSTGAGSTPLASGVTYQIRVHAINEFGVGPDSQPVSAALPNPGSPAAPGSVTAATTGDTAAGDKISVTFNAPSPGDSPILRYQYSTNDGRQWSDATTTGTGSLHVDITAESGTDFPLYPGQPYRVRIRAVNTQGPGLPSTAAEVTLPPTEPGAPFGVHGEPGDRTITLTWGTSDNGDEITGYAYSTDDGTSWQPLSAVTFNNDDWTTNATITNASTGDGSTRLQNGQTYQIRLRATNSLGTGPHSEPVAVQLPLPGSPGRPGDLTPSPLGDHIGIDFAAPSPGDSPILKYQYSTDEGNTWTDTTTTGGGPPHIDISLESGTGFPLGHDNRYRIRVRAVNTQGAGLPSKSTEISLPATEPGKPTGVTPAPGNKQVTVEFSVDSNGPDLTAIEYSTDDGAHWRALENITQLDKMHYRATITKVSTSGDDPLTNAVPYQLRLRASNELGTGPASDAVSFTPAADAPGAPSEVTPTAGDRRITVTYKVTDDGGGPIIGLRYSTDGGTTWFDATPTGTGTFTVVITKQSTGDGTAPLVNGVTYSVRLLLRNAGGAGTPTGAVTVTPITVPDAPGGLTATPSNASGSLQFPAPGTGGNAITGYDYSTDNGTTWATLPTPNGTSALTATITTASSAGQPALTNGTTYQVTVRARNTAGPGAASPTAALTPRTTAGAPVSLTAAPRNRSAALSFTAPPDTGAGAVTAYQVSTNDGGSWAGLTTANGAGGALTATVADLANNTAYQVKVRAVTAAGPGAATGAVAVTPLAPPVAPTGVLATAHTATITVTWTASAAGGAPVTGYTAIAAPGPATCDTDGATTCILGGQADQPYTITVVANSASGDSSESPPSTSVTATPPVIPPAPPVTNEKLDTPTGDDSTTEPGATITIKGTGYAPNSTVEIVVYSTPISLGTVVTDNNGEFSVDVVMPPTLPIGEHSIAAMGADPQGNVRAMRLDVTVAPAVPTTPTTPPVLAITGRATADTAMLSLLMLVLGAGLVRASQTGRRQPRHRNTR